MKTTIVRRRIALTVVTILILSTAAFAGPPLICHKIDIGNAKSLPWVSQGWQLTGTENYDTKNLANDTIAILDSSQTVLVHMETLRRATVYAKTDPKAAKELLAKLHARSDAGNRPTALAVFDAGYLASSYSEMFHGNGNPATGIDGFGMVAKAISLRGTDPQMEFAAALIAMGDQQYSAHRSEHARKAMEGAKSDPLLAKNLASRFGGDKSNTIAEMFTNSGR
jgi:hypothetical protein